MSSSSGVTEFNAAEKLSLPTEGVVQVNSNLSAVDNNNVNSIVADSIQEQQTRIPRVRTLTERGQAYQEDRQRERDREEDQLIKRFYEAFDAWKAQASDIERYIADQLPLSQTDKRKYSPLQGSPRQCSNDIREVTKVSASWTRNSPKDRLMRCINQEGPEGVKWDWDWPKIWVGKWDLIHWDWNFCNGNGTQNIKWELE